ncbi:hypothetical protein RchiOBHm_Chr0c22g0500701 [Rosa chinensis]|uniref:Uncharacterized protein n=1 Tax=Rosa chinensis TaxID=74649 RepID=A0A2P6SQI8_ROSCH|nr:hypothetical protein RchiOBHm_Chr0c22g0500701 [Rosa chinensis]
MASDGGLLGACGWPGWDGVRGGSCASRSGDRTLMSASLIWLFGCGSGFGFSEESWLVRVWVVDGMLVAVQIKRCRSWWRVPCGFGSQEVDRGAQIRTVLVMAA